MGQHSDLSENLECGSKKCTNLIDFLSVMPMFTLLGCIFFLIFTPIFYWRIFLPCVDCYDFEVCGGQRAAARELTDPMPA